MKQAIGRARRHGQEKVVHIYEFVTSKTVDVDILEQRNDKILKHRGTSYQDPDYSNSDNIPYPGFKPGSIELMDPQFHDESLPREYSTEARHLYCIPDADWA